MVTTPFEFRAVSDREFQEDWDGWLSGFRDGSIRQSRAWAGHKTGSWAPRPVALFAGGAPRVLALALERRAPLGLAKVAWVNAGPVYRRGDDAEDRASLAGFLRGLTAHYGSRVAVRFMPLAPWSDADADVLSEAGFVPARATISSGLTSVVELSGPEEELRARLDRKWRNQLKKAESFAPQFEFGRDAGLIERYRLLHEELCRRRGLQAERMSVEALEKAARDFGPALTFAIASVDGRDGAGLAWWRLGGRATLWLSAANDWGMAKNLPNALYWTVVRRLKDEGARLFDLAGLDPANNPGVTHFKLGLGGGTFKTLGEWDWSGDPLTRRAFGLVLGAVRSRMPR